MFSPLFLTEFIGGAVDSTVWLSLAIIAGTLVLEDPTIVIVGVLASDGTISLPLALSSLYIGVVLGDIAFYSLGYLASKHSRLGKYVDHAHIATFRTWLETRYVLTLFSARFIPGSRFPTYAASGFLRSSFSTFMLTTIAATSVWTTILFGLSYWFGSATAEWFQNERWLIALGFVVVLFGIGRYNLKRANPKDTLNILDS